jgi:hypothetical protein
MLPMCQKQQEVKMILKMLLRVKAFIVSNYVFVFVFLLC